MSFRGFVLVALLILSALFILQNIQIVHVSFLVWTISMPGALLLTLTLCIGIVIGFAIPKRKR